MIQGNAGRGAYVAHKRFMFYARKISRILCFCCRRKSDAEKEAEMEILRQEADTSDAWLDINKITDVMNHFGGIDDPIILYQMETHQALKEAGLDWKRLWTSVSKLDCDQRGKVRLNEVMECMVRAKRDVDGLDVAAARSTFRRLTRKSRALDHMTEDLGNGIKSVLHRFSEKDTVEERRATRDALLERRKHLADFLEINMDIINFKDIKTFKMLLRSAAAFEGGPEQEQSVTDHRNSRGEKVRLSMSPSSPVLRFESAEAKMARNNAADESRRIFAMEE
jgi:hypothetical protein